MQISYEFNWNYYSHSCYILNSIVNLPHSEPHMLLFFCLALCHLLNSITTFRNYMHFFPVQLFSIIAFVHLNQYWKRFCFYINFFEVLFGAHKFTSSHQEILKLVLLSKFFKVLKIIGFKFRTMFNNTIQCYKKTIV